ncbi:hypothetical protein H8S90_21140 [Olivibacter sp. SDN3]|uniref:Blp family class II bacteriocin n=1 Tax=Olivibacter sp. SDN3 TaxID=2764720 RepID=UPI001650F76A|nr:Blp family class II bacteriocin [Olivibacter sp. SDN3]QNL49217.1 hypothetical protein H8S90_21140 [Olivibacter sp. SDN3]
MRTLSVENLGLEELSNQDLVDVNGGTTLRCNAGAAGSAIGGALTGAAAGSVIPVIGTLGGAAIGALGGALLGTAQFCLE